MADSSRVTCPRCGKLLPVDGPAGHCPHRPKSDARNARTQVPPVRSSSPARASRKLRKASALAYLGAILLGGDSGSAVSGEIIRPRPKPNTNAA